MSELADHASPHKVEESVKGREAPEIKSLGADAIDEPAVQREHQRERQQIAARHPLDRRKADVQIGGKASKRHIDDRGVELCHEGANGRNTDHFPNARSEPVGLIVAARQYRVTILR